MPQQRPVPILFVHHRSELGGAPESLSYLIRELDRERSSSRTSTARPGLRPSSSARRARVVHTGAVAGLHAHLGLDLPGTPLAAASPASSRACRATCTSSGGRCASERFELVHFNDSPLIPAAWLARREGLPVVWHLRSALPEGGTRPPLRVRSARAIARARDDLDRDQPRRRGTSSASHSTVVPNSVDLAALPSRRPRRARSAALGLPAGPVRSSRSSASSTRPRASASSSRRRRDCASAGVEASYLIVGGAVRGRGVLPDRGRSRPPARRPDARLRVGGEAARRRARRSTTSCASSRSRRTRPNLYQAIRRRRRALAGAGARPAGDRGGGERRPRRGVGLAHGRRRRRARGDGRARRRLTAWSSMADAVAELLQRSGRAGPPLGRAARAHAEDEVRPRPQRPADRGDLPADRPRPRAHPDPLRPPPAAARRGAVEPRAADPPPRPALRAARVLPGGPGGGAVRGGGRRSCTRATSRSSRTPGTRPYEGLRWLVARPRDRVAAAAPAPARPADAHSTASRSCTSTTRRCSPPPGWRTATARRSSGTCARRWPARARPPERG